MDHQYMPKVFHDPNKNPLPHPCPLPRPPTYLMYGPLFCKEYLAVSLENIKQF